eukprot:jgi/Mesen1/7284/ME000373S06355
MPLSWATWPAVNSIKSVHRVEKPNSSLSTTLLEKTNQPPPCQQTAPEVQLRTAAGCVSGGNFSLNLPRTLSTDAKAPDSKGGQETEGASRRSPGDVKSAEVSDGGGPSNVAGIGTDGRQWLASLEAAGGLSESTEGGGSEVPSAGQVSLLEGLEAEVATREWRTVPNTVLEAVLKRQLDATTDVTEVMLVHGPRGVGKRTTVEGLVEGWRQRPHAVAYVDLESPPPPQEPPAAGDSERSKHQARLLPWLPCAAYSAPFLPPTASPSGRFDDEGNAAALPREEASLGEEGRPSGQVEARGGDSLQEDLSERHSVTSSDTSSGSERQAGSLHPAVGDGSARAAGLAEAASSAPEAYSTPVEKRLSWATDWEQMQAQTRQVYSLESARRQIEAGLEALAVLAVDEGHLDGAQIADRLLNRHRVNAALESYLLSQEGRGEVGSGNSGGGLGRTPHPEKARDISADVDADVEATAHMWLRALEAMKGSEEFASGAWTGGAKVASVREQWSGGAAAGQVSAAQGSVHLDWGAGASEPGSSVLPDSPDPGMGGEMDGLTGGAVEGDRGVNRYTPSVVVPPLPSPPPAGYSGDDTELAPALEGKSQQGEQEDWGEEGAALSGGGKGRGGREDVEDARVSVSEDGLLTKLATAWKDELAEGGPQQGQLSLALAKKLLTLQEAARSRPARPGAETLSPNLTYSGPNPGQSPAQDPGQICGAGNEERARGKSVADAATAWAGLLLELVSLASQPGVFQVCSGAPPGVPPTLPPLPPPQTSS